MELIKQIKETEEKLATLRVELEKQNNTKLDYSKWVGRGTLAIKGEKLLISFDDGDIHYTNLYRDSYTDKVDYEVVNRSDLKVGDLCINDSINYNDTELSDFKIFRGINDNDRYMFNYLMNNDGIELLDSVINYNDCKVKRFLRN